MEKSDTKGKRWYSIVFVILLGVGLSVIGPGEPLYAQQEETNNTKTGQYTAVFGQSGADNNIIYKEGELISFHFDNISLTKALNKLAAELNVGLAFEAALTLDKKVTLTLRKVTAYEAFDQLLAGTGLEAIVPKSRDVVFIKKQNQKQPEPGTISGTVTDANSGELLPGVNVLIKGTTTGTSTDAQGTYELSVASMQDTLVFSYIGYQTREIPINGRTTIDVSLKSTTLTGEEMIVVGYGQQEEETVTGAISSVPVGDMQEAPTMSVSNTLGGRVAGILSRQTSGQPGHDSANLKIRGLGTWANSDPLILVDGIERTLDDLNPEQIESVSILKDASATAVYGVQGANGVILIETKRGHQGTPQVSFKSEFATLEPLRRPQFVDGVQYAQLVNESRINMGESPEYTQEEIEKIRTGSDPYFYPNVDWMDMIFKDRTYQMSHNLSISGGGDVARYYVNANFGLKNGIYKASSLSKFNTNAQAKRYNLRSNVDVNVSENLIIRMGLGGNIRNRNYPGTGGTGVNNVLWSMRFTSPIEFPPYNPDGSLAAGSNWAQSWNPVAEVMRGGYTTYTYNKLQTTFSADWDLSDLVTKGLNAKATFAYDYYTSHRTQRSKQNAKKKYLGTNEQGEDQYQIIQEEQPLGYWRSNDSNKSTDIQFQLNWKRSIGARHELSSLLLFKQREYVHVNAGSSIGNLPHRNRGVSGRLTYGYDNRYLLELNAGYNGSENFPKDSRYGFFPSVSAGWIISSENFWNIGPINHLKLRGSYGQVGNDDIGGRRYLYLTRYSRGSAGYRFGSNHRSVNGLGVDLRGNPNLSWEVSTKTNLGFDLELFDSKIILQANAFKEHRTGILLQRNTIPTFLGYEGGALPYSNLGVVDNRGIDGILKVRNTTSGGLSYQLRGTFTFARNEVVENDEPPREYAYQSRKGHPVGQPFGLIALGFFESQEEINNHATQTFQNTIRPGDVKYKDVNDDGVVDQFDEVAIGYPNTTPEIMAGLGGSIAYQNWEFSAFFRGATHTSQFVGGAAFWPFQSGSGNYNLLQEYAGNRWTESNKSGAEYPAVRYGDYPNNYRQSTMNMKDASFIRLKSAKLAYNLPASFLDKYNIRNLEIFLRGQNLYTWDKIDYTNPQGGVGGNGSYPIHRKVNLGVEIDI